jgi:hypothetical protein
MLFFRQLSHLLPRGAAWRVTIDKTLRRFFLGLSAQPEETRAYIDKVYLDLFPATARSKDDPVPAERSGALEEWEKQFGLTPSATASEASRRLALAAEWQATGGQSAGYIQGVLQAAGFNVYVHEWWSSGPPYVARDPRIYTTVPRIGTNRCQSLPTTVSKPRCSAFASQSRCNAFLANDPHYLVNKDLTRRPPPPVPDDPMKWRYFMYVAAASFPTPATVDVARRDEFERLILKLRPAHLWIVTLVNYVAEAGSRLLTESGDFLVTESGDRIVV